MVLSTGPRRELTTIVERCCQWDALYSPAMPWPGPTAHLARDYQCSVARSMEARVRGAPPVFYRTAHGLHRQRDTLKQVELKFPTLASAIRNPQRQGLCYVVADNRLPLDARLLISAEK